MSTEVQQFYKESRYERIAIFCAAVAFYTRHGKTAPDKASRDTDYNRGAAAVSFAQRLDQVRNTHKLGFRV